MKKLLSQAELDAKKQSYEVALQQYYVEIDAAKECHFRGDKDGVKHHREAARVLQKDITTYLSMCTNVFSHDNK